jgi:hypothetical protein
VKRWPWSASWLPQGDLAALVGRHLVVWADTRTPVGDLQLGESQLGDLQVTWWKLPAPLCGSGAHTQLHYTTAQGDIHLFVEVQPQPYSLIVPAARPRRCPSGCDGDAL